MFQLSFSAYICMNMYVCVWKPCRKYSAASHESFNGSFCMFTQQPNSQRSAVDEVSSPVTMRGIARGERRSHIYFSSSRLLKDFWNRRFEMTQLSLQPYKHSLPLCPRSISLPLVKAAIKKSPPGTVRTYESSSLARTNIKTTKPHNYHRIPKKAGP